MSSSADRFWNVVGHWKRDQPRIVVEVSGQRPPMLLTFTAVVEDVARGIITFRDVETDDARPLDFGGAEIRLHSFERIEAVGAFAARWEEGPEAIDCVLTELREFGKPN
jgi:hypothetical protein